MPIVVRSFTPISSSRTDRTFICFFPRLFSARKAASCPAALDYAARGRLTTCIEAPARRLHVACLATGAAGRD